MGEVGAGFVDRLVLADQAAQLAADRPRARLQRRIGQTLARLDRLGGERGQQEQATQQIQVLS